MKLIKKTGKKPAASPAPEKQDSKPKYANLKEVMDYSVPFKLIFSGVENESYFKILEGMGVKNFLMSYHYIKNSHINIRDRFEGSDIRLFIDSGAHTYQNDPKYFEYGIDYWEDHLKSYLRWAEKNKNHIFAIANFDFENIVGPDVVERWNKEFFEPFMLRTGLPVCFVWHQNSSKPWDYYCSRYPYVGFSSVNTEGVAIDLAEYKERLRVAEKHDSLVHGFGMTRTSMLTELPFYTSDSTTWLVGLQYGEMNFWNNSKMSRLKKDKWQGTYLETICSRYGLDRELLLSEDVTEMIKANVHAFIDAEEYIHTRLKSSMYWLKAKSVKQDADNLPDDFFPPRPWFKDDDPLGAKDYARKMNINPEVSNLLDIISDVTAFLNWDNPAYADFVDWYKSEEQESLINELHDQFINRIVPDQETKIHDLQQFYKDCISGVNDKLLHLETNFDRTIRERESYIEDEEETELVDLTPEEVKVKLAGILPCREDENGMPEVTDLDEEIFKDTDIVPCFDSRGKFVKGQTRVKKPKKLYSSKFPKVSCDTCYAAQKCPEYKAGYACAFNKMFERYSTRNMSDIIQAMQGMADFNLARMQRAMVIENLTGNFDPNVTSFINQNMNILKNLRDIYNAGSAEVLRQTRVVRSDGSEEHTTTVTNPQSGGILEKLFSNLQSDSKEEEIIEGEVVPQKNDRYKDIEE